MLARSEKFTRKDFLEIKGVKFQKIPTNIGFFCFYRGAVFNKKTIVVSKKKFKTAVSRNKQKRIFFNTIPSFELLQDKCFIFYPNKLFSKKDLEVALSKLVI